MSILFLAEHNNKEIKSSTYNCIFAASQIDKEVEVLVIGYDCQNIAAQISKVAKALTPVPGGVGPMTIACLLNNTVECFEKAHTK